MDIKNAKISELYEAYRENNEFEFSDEPTLMRASRVERILDITPSTRKRLVHKGELKTVKTGDSQQSAMRITKESVINIVSMWQAKAEVS
jgi:hypothetical protein|tara:strand:- start:8453 stop:8722 length:270 start_codon:yes stop_codon:yes gene_type:complete